MTHQYSIDQAQSQFEAILSGVESGTPVELLRAGQPIAVVISSEEYARLTSGQPPNFWQALQIFRQDFNLEQAGFDVSTFENLRDTSPGREVIL